MLEKESISRQRERMIFEIESLSKKALRHNPIGAHKAIMDSGHHNIWGIGPQTFYRIDINRYLQNRAQSIT